MRLILDTFWAVTGWTAAILAAPHVFFNYLLSMVLRWTTTGQSNGTRHIGRGRPNTAIFP